MHRNAINLVNGTACVALEQLLTLEDNMRNRLRLGLIVAFTTILQGCAGVESLTGQQPIVDMKGVNPDLYSADLLECQQYVDEVRVGPQVATGAATGAVLGGVAGAVLGRGDDAARGATVGGVTGGVRGAGNGMNDRRMVLRNCLIGRGYYVLN